MGTLFPEARMEIGGTALGTETQGVPDGREARDRQD
jgi:hypothetical protein